jgi:hypothetical protein
MVEELRRQRELPFEEAFAQAQRDRQAALGAVDPAAGQADDAGAVSRSTRDLFQRASAKARGPGGEWRKVLLVARSARTVPPALCLPPPRAAAPSHAPRFDQF